MTQRTKENLYLVMAAVQVVVCAYVLYNGDRLIPRGTVVVRPTYLVCYPSGTPQTLACTPSRIAP